MSETYKGNYAPDLFNENKHYYLLQAQQKATLTDAELRDLNDIANVQTRHFIKSQVGDAAAVRTGYKITQGLSPSERINDFLITGPDATGLGYFFLDGYGLFLNSPIRYTDQTRYADHTSEGAITLDGYTETILPSLTTPSGTNADLYGVCFGGSKVFVCGTQVISRSPNAGVDWTNATTYSSTLNSISFCDSNVGLAAGQDGSITITINGGSSWDTILPSSATLNSAIALTPLYAWVAGQDGTILHTSTLSNGISSIWSNQYGPTNVALYGITGTPDTFNGWAVGEYGTILNTSDQGTNWYLQTSNVGGNLYGVYAADTLNVYAAGADGTVLTTYDGGTTWTAVLADTTETLNSVYFVDATRGWVAGNNGVISYTVNKGVTWSSSTIASGIDLKSIVFSDTTGFVVSSNGKIYRSLDNGITWDLYRTDRVYIDFHLAEVSGDSTSGSEYVDPGIVDSTIGLPSANRLRLVADVRVSEGWPIPSNYTTDGTVQHITTPLARIQRTAGDPIITDSSITDLRIVVTTPLDIKEVLTTGGIGTSAIADGAITSEKIQSTDDFSFNSVDISGDATIHNNLIVLGDTGFVDMMVDNLQVNDSAVIGTDPSLNSHIINGQVTHLYDGSTSQAYNLVSTSLFDNTSVFSISSLGTGSVLEMSRDNTDSSIPFLSIADNGKAYSLEINHTGKSGGILNAEDDATGGSVIINKNGPGEVLSITTTSSLPAISIVNHGLLGSSVVIDQTSGNLITLNSLSDATVLGIKSQGASSDIHIVHMGAAGRPLDITSSSLQGSIDVFNDQGTAISVKQIANRTLMVLDKSSAGPGLGLEINNRGEDVGLGVYNTGYGVGQLISHVGDSTQPALDIFVAGNERGAALRINKSNDATGEVARLWNQGLGGTIWLSQDRTDNTFPIIAISNSNTSGLDISSNNWSIDNSGNFYTRGIIISQGTTGIQGETGVQGIRGLTGLRGFTGLRGLTGLQGITGPQGFIGQTGIQGIQGDTGIFGVDGQTGIQGPQGSTGLGTDGLTGIQGPQGVTGLGADGMTGIQGPQGATGLGADGVTGIQGPQGATGLGADGVTGIQGPQGATGFGLQGSTGFGVGTRSISWTIANPGVGGIPGPKMAQDGTVIRISSYVTSATSASFNIYDRTNVSQTGTALLSIDQTATTTATDGTVFASTSLPANSWLWLQIDATSGLPGYLAVSVTYNV